MYLLNTLRLLLLLAAMACSAPGCGNSRSSQREDGGGPGDASMHEDSGHPAPGDGGPGPVLVRTLRCARSVAVAGAPRQLAHVVHLYAGGATTVSCSAGRAAGSASYRYGQTGQPGAVCFVDEELDAPSGGYFRFYFVPGAQISVATYVDAGSTLSPREWELPCSTPEPL